MLEIKVTIEAPELSAAINHLADSIGKGIPAPVKQEVEKPTIPASVAQPAAPAVQAPVQQAQTVIPPQPTAPAPTAPTAPAPVAQAAPITLEAISRAGAALIDQGKMQQIMGLLAKYGVQAITQLQPNAYDAFATDLRALGASI